MNVASCEPRGAPTELQPEMVCVGPALVVCNVTCTEGAAKDKSIDDSSKFTWKVAVKFPDPPELLPTIFTS